MLCPKINQLAAEYTAAALVSLFPKVTLIQARHQRFGFSVEATVPKGFSIETFPHIEERVRQLPNIEIREMMGWNAAEYLRSINQVVRAQEAKEVGKNLVTIVQIGDFIDYCQYPIAQKFDGFRLLECYQKNDHVYIVGAAAATQKETKIYAKNLGEYKKNDHTNLFPVRDGQICISPKYEAMRFALLCKWREFVHAHGGEIYDGPEVPTKGFCAKISQCSGLGEYGLLDAATYHTCELHHAPEGAVKKFLESFGLEITEKEQKYYTSDAFGTFWCIGTEKMCYASLERLLALMIENNCQELLC